MARKSVIFLLLIILTMIHAGCKTQKLGMPEYKKAGITKFDMDLFSLLHLLEANMPLTRQKIEDIGFELIEMEGKPGRKYRAPPVELQDGLFLVDIGFDQRTVDFTIFVLEIRGKAITRQDLKNNLGEFTLLSLPRGHSRYEEIVYIKRIGESGIITSYGQHARDTLTGVAFHSREPLEQEP